MSTRVESKSEITKWNIGNWVIELVGEQVRLTDRTGKALIYELGAVMFQERNATYNFQGYCHFHGKTPASVLAKVKDVVWDVSQSPTLSTTKNRFVPIGESNL